MTAEEIVASLVKAHKALDMALTSARQAALDIEKGHEEGVKIGLVKALQAKDLIHRARQLTGSIANVGALSASLHIDDTTVAKKQGIDAGTLTEVCGINLLISRGGGDR